MLLVRDYENGRHLDNLARNAAHRPAINGGRWARFRQRYVLARELLAFYGHRGNGLRINAYLAAIGGAYRLYPGKASVRAVLGDHDRELARLWERLRQTKALARAARIRRERLETEDPAV